MVGLVLISHGKMAEGIADSLSMLFGADLPQFEICALREMNSPQEFHDELCRKVAKVDCGDGVLIFADMLGGTPCNQALTLVNEKVHLIVGMNLPMILELLGMRETQPAEVSAILENGRQAIQDAGALLLAQAGSESDEDDD